MAGVRDESLAFQGPGKSCQVRASAFHLTRGQLGSTSAWEEDQAGVDTFKAILVPLTHSCPTPMLSEQFSEKLSVSLIP